MLNLNKANNSTGFHILASCLCLIGLSGCWRGDVHDHPDLVAGKQLFEYHCAECHKSNGNGEFLKGVPANKNARLSAHQLTHKIRGEDVDVMKMPHFHNMSEDEADKISSYVKDMNPNNRQNIVILEDINPNSS